MDEQKLKEFNQEFKALLDKYDVDLIPQLVINARVKPVEER